MRLASFQLARPLVLRDQPDQFLTAEPCNQPLRLLRPVRRDTTAPAWGSTQLSPLKTTSQRLDQMQPPDTLLRPVRSAQRPSGATNALRACQGQQGRRDRPRAALPGVWHASQPAPYDRRSVRPTWLERGRSGGGPLSRPSGSEAAWCLLSIEQIIRTRGRAFHAPSECRHDACWPSHTGHPAERAAFGLIRSARSRPWPARWHRRYG